MCWLGFLSAASSSIIIMHYYTYYYNYTTLKLLCTKAATSQDVNTKKSISQYHLIQDIGSYATHTLKWFGIHTKIFYTSFSSRFYCKEQTYMIPNHCFVPMLQPHCRVNPGWQHLFWIVQEVKVSVIQEQNPKPCCSLWQSYKLWQSYQKSYKNAVVDMYPTHLLNKHIQDIQQMKTENLYMLIICTDDAWNMLILTFQWYGITLWSLERENIMIFSVSSKPIPVQRWSKSSHILSIGRYWLPLADNSYCTQSKITSMTHEQKLIALIAQCENAQEQSPKPCCSL